MNKGFSRRTFTGGGGAAAALSFLPWPAPAAASDKREPHFFLQIVLPGGMDPTYSFDARPLSLTRKGLLANYRNKEPIVWEGPAGGSTWATELTAPLRPFRHQISVLNGVMMAAAFDGHAQNMNYLFTGNPFGGASFVPRLNQGPEASPLDFLQSGFFLADISNAAAGLPLTVQQARSLVGRLRKNAPLQPESPLFRFAASRMAANGNGPGRFSQAAENMGEAFAKAPDLSRKLRALDLEGLGSTNTEKNAGLAGEFFRRHIAKSAILTVSPDNGTLDTHSPGGAQSSPRLVGDMLGRIAEVLSTFANTPYDDDRSLLDVTTVVACSEFARTMRQPGQPIDNTGTDHNSLTNTVLLAGKGIHGGRVVGASDYRTPDEVLSGAHREADPAGLKIMGQPFDVSSLRPRKEMPKHFDTRDYLTFSSLTNTIYRLFGIPRDHYVTTKRNGPVAPVLDGLLL